MNSPSPQANEAPAQVLALMVAANGHVKEQELQTLDQLDAYARLGVSRERFVELAQRCVEAVGASLCEQSWLRMSDMLYMDRLLDAVSDEGTRLLVCRLSAAAITADGSVTRDERMVYDHTLARWHISQALVSDAILHDRVHRSAEDHHRVPRVRSHVGIRHPAPAARSPA